MQMWVQDTIKWYLAYSSVLSNLGYTITTLSTAQGGGHRGDRGTLMRSETFRPSKLTEVVRRTATALRGLAGGSSDLGAVFSLVAGDLERVVSRCCGQWRECAVFFKAHARPCPKWAP